MYKKMEEVLEDFEKKGYVLPEDFSEEYSFKEFIEEYQDKLIAEAS